MVHIYRHRYRYPKKELSQSFLKLVLKKVWFLLLYQNSRVEKSVAAQFLV